MNDYTVSDLPIIALSGLEGNMPTSLTATQQMLAPYTDLIIAFWALTFCATVLYVTAWHVLVPLVRSWL